MRAPVAVAMNVPWLNARGRSPVKTARATCDGRAATFSPYGLIHAMMKRGG